MSKQVYYEGLYGRLIPVKNLRRENRNNSSAEVAKTGMGYTAGETITALSLRFVHKAGFRDGWQLVATVDH